MTRILSTRCPTCGGDRAVYQQRQRSTALADWTLPEWLLVCPSCQQETETVTGAYSEEADSGMIYCRRDQAAEQG